jgi:hypothetical protein
MATTADEADERARDAEEHRRIYHGIMKAASQVAVPFAMALTMFFTQLLLGAGWWAILWFIATYLLVLWIVKSFFSH